MDKELEDLEIPEEPTEEEELNDLKVEEEFKNQKLQIQHQDTQDSQSSVIGFMTAVKIARWMARAYGYTAKKRNTFLIEAKVVKHKEIVEPFQTNVALSWLNLAISS